MRQRYTERPRPASGWQPRLRGGQAGPRRFSGPKTTRLSGARQTSAPVECPRAHTACALVLRGRPGRGPRGARAREHPAPRRPSRGELPRRRRRGQHRRLRRCRPHRRRDAHSGRTNQLAPVRVDGAALDGGGSRRRLAVGNDPGRGAPARHRRVCFSTSESICCVQAVRRQLAGRTGSWTSGRRS